MFSTICGTFVKTHCGPRDAFSLFVCRLCLWWALECSLRVNDVFCAVSLSGKMWTLKITVPEKNRLSRPRKPLACGQKQHPFCRTCSGCLSSFCDTRGSKVLAILRDLLELSHNSHTFVCADLVPLLLGQQSGSELSTSELLGSAKNFDIKETGCMWEEGVCLGTRGNHWRCRRGVNRNGFWLTRTVQRKTANAEMGPTQLWR